MPFWLRPIRRDK
jgi:hypothetical protein